MADGASLGALALKHVVRNRSVLCHGMVTRFRFHATADQIPSGRLAAAVRAEERAGFTGGRCGDHVESWSTVQSESDFAWSWLGAVPATTGLPLGVVSAPGQRFQRQRGCRDVDAESALPDGEDR